MIISRPGKKMKHDVKPMVISEIQIRFLFKTTDTTNDENANPNGDFSPHIQNIPCRSNNFLCLETEIQVFKWAISTALQCLRSKLSSRATMCYRRTMT